MTATSPAAGKQLTGPTGRNLLPEIEDRVPVLKEVKGWADFSPEILSVWAAPYGESEAWNLNMEDQIVDGPHGPIPVRIYQPKDAVDHRRALVWFHGGAFVGGGLDMAEAHEVSRGIAGRAKVTVISVDYQLCPLPDRPITDGDVRFPVPHDEAVAVYRWALKDAGRLGIDPSKVAIGGASAGANLAAGAALRLAHEGVRVWQALLAYPLVHPTMPTPSEELEEAMLSIPAALKVTPEAWTRLNENYLGAPVAKATEYAFPGLSRDLSLFPPTYIDNCEFDELRSSGEAFAEELQKAAVDVETRTTHGVLHGHLNNVGFGPARASMDEFARRLTSWPAE